MARAQAAPRAVGDVRARVAAKAATTAAARALPGLAGWLGGGVAIRVATRLTIGVALGMAVWQANGLAHAADVEPGRLLLHVEEPRAFGHRSGDVVERRVWIDVPAPLVLDPASLPVVGPAGPVIELRAVEQAEAEGRLDLRLRYQIFAAPTAVRTYELPAFVLRFEGAPRVEELRIDAWPVVVAPLAAEQVSYRAGLGELRPDQPPPPRATHTERALLWTGAALALPVVAYLALVYLGVPGWARWQRPFERAYRAVRASHGADWQASYRAMHAAFDQTAGRTVFADSVDAFVARSPRYAALSDDIARFYARSQSAFFGGPEGAGGDSFEDATRPHGGDWLLGFARACRDAERGSA